MTAAWLLLAVLTAPGSPQSVAEPGERAFQRCLACHALQTSAESGPRLNDVFGRRAGAVGDFVYSDAMKAAGRRGVVWDAPALERFLSDPDAIVPGTTMPYQGGSATERQVLIDWLRRSTDPCATGCDRPRLGAGGHGR